MPETPQREPILVKRYAYSRLYDTTAAQYRTVDELRHWAETGVRFAVVDVETGHDVTQALLA
jgi:polyhydroxyalkanoate synthesis regulator protein